MLGDAAHLCQDRWHGDLRRLHREADGDVDRLRGLLTEFPGIGPTGADIFLREVQAVWPDIAPFADAKVVDGAERLHLPRSADQLAGLVSTVQLPKLAAALVRVARDRRAADAVLREAQESVSFSALKGPSLRIVTARGDEHEVTPRSAG
jgi:hypothetical protein